MINQVVSAPPGGSAIYTFALAPGASFNVHHIASTSGAAGAAFCNVFGAVSAGFNGLVAGPYRYVSKLASGVNPAGNPFVGGGPGGFGTLAFAYGYQNSQWLDAGTGFVGFRFNTGGGVQYGWARLTMNGSPLNSFTMVDYAWGDVGDTILTGQIPEPGSLALLAVGAVGLLAWRKQRAKASKAA